MSFDWAEFNELAQELIGHPGLNATVEATCRTAISRAYYAAFCTALERLVYVDSVYIDNSRDAHQQVAVHLSTPRALRNVADYEATPSQVIDTFVAQDCIHLAAVVIDMVRNL